MLEEKRSIIKVIDFGSSCLTSEKMFKYIQSRFYRAPEVILELDYGCPADMWSCGMILVELCDDTLCFPLFSGFLIFWLTHFYFSCRLTGDPLCPGEDEYDQLHKMVEGLLLNAKRFLVFTPRGSAWDATASNDRSISKKA